MIKSCYMAFTIVGLCLSGCADNVHLISWSYESLPIHDYFAHGPLITGVNKDFDILSGNATDKDKESSPKRDKDYDAIYLDGQKIGNGSNGATKALNTFHGRCFLFVGYFTYLGYHGPSGPIYPTGLHGFLDTDQLHNWKKRNPSGRLIIGNDTGIELKKKGLPKYHLTFGKPERRDEVIGGVECLVIDMDTVECYLNKKLIGRGRKGLKKAVSSIPSTEDMLIDYLVYGDRSYDMEYLQKLIENREGTVMYEIQSE